MVNIRVYGRDMENRMPANPLDMPATEGRTVTEAHAKICAQRGHATHKVDGVESELCPRCGERRSAAPVAKGPYYADQESGTTAAYVDGIKVAQLDGHNLFDEEKNLIATY